HSPAINMPFRQLGHNGEGLERVLAGQYCESDDPIIIAVHLSSPKIHWLDRGKAGISLRGADVGADPDTYEDDPQFYQDEVADPNDGSVASKLIAAVKAVTKRWHKAKRAAIRDSGAKERRQAAMLRERGTSQKEIAFEVMDDAVMRVTDGGKLYGN